MPGVQVARYVARAIGWLFVALIAYHAVRGWSQAGRAVSDGNWARAGEVTAIALVATAVVVAAIVAAVRSTR